MALYQISLSALYNGVKGMVSALGMRAAILNDD